jgi:hypothetical protein
MLPGFSPEAPVQQICLSLLCQLLGWLLLLVRELSVERLLLLEQLLGEVAPLPAVVQGAAPTQRGTLRLQK